MGYVELFDRKAELTVAPIDGQDGILIKDLRIAFSIEKTKTSEPNKATIKVYNLSAETRNWIKKKEQGIELKAGYRDSIGRIYAGDIDRLEHRREEVDIITEIFCKDGGNDLVEAEFQKSYKPGTPRTRIVQDVVRAFPNVGFGNAAASIVDGNTTSKLVLSGGCRRILDRLARIFDFEWSVQDGDFQMLEEGTGTISGQTLAIVLNSATGMVGIPTKTDRGATAKSLLIPSTRPGSYVILESEFVSGSYRTDKATHNGDTQGGDWVTEMELKSL